MVFLLGFLRIAWPYLLGALILGVGYYKANHWCNTACQNATERAVEAEGTLEAVKKREAAIASLWASQVDKTEAAARLAETKRNEQFDAVANKARGLPAVDAAVRIPASALGVLNDAHRIAEPARSAEKLEDPTPSDTATAGEVTQWGVAMLKWAAACRDRVSEWESFYGGLHEQSQ